MISKTVEPQYEICLNVESKAGRARLGLMSNQVWHDDPKRLLFVLSRYKFVSKMLSGKKSVLEVGCSDAFCTRIVKQVIPNVVAVDIDPAFISDYALFGNSDDWGIDCRVHDILTGPISEGFDGCYSLDVFEHIDPKYEDDFIVNSLGSLSSDGVMIIGMPSIESQKYASAGSIAGHVNCKAGESLKDLCEKYFKNVFMFSMNDEVVHTGFFRMANYIFAVCTNQKI
jgi:cyclopropane fatty-acyl-phospholipid synthase-like methyltransferase